MVNFHESRPASENPYRDRLEGDVLTYTAAGRVGAQTLAGINQRLLDQRVDEFPIHGFSMVASRRDRTIGPRRWRYMGLLGYRCHFPDTQLDSAGGVRRVWLFEFSVHGEPGVIPVAADSAIWAELVRTRGAARADAEDEAVVLPEVSPVHDFERLEAVRRRLLALEPRCFELFLKDLLVRCGFRDVCVTKFSSDGGIDVNARAAARMWVFEDTQVQIQAKRWLHSVGRKEVAELRGSLQPYARGAVVTTSHFSRAAIREASEPGKQPITLVDGVRLSRIVVDEDFEM